MRVIYVVVCTEDCYTLFHEENAAQCIYLLMCYSEWCCFKRFSPILLGEYLHALLWAIYLGTEFSGVQGPHMHLFSLASVDAAKYFSKATVPMLANFLLKNFLDSSLKFASHIQPPIRSSS